MHHWRAMPFLAASHTSSATRQPSVSVSTEMLSIRLVFMTQYLMGAGGHVEVMTADEAKSWYHLFVSAVYLTPLLGALLSDGLLGIHAKQGVLLSERISPSRSKKLSRSESSKKIFLRLIPLTMIWCSAPGASIRAFRGIINHVSDNSRSANRISEERPP